MLTTQWAHAAAEWPDEQRTAEFEAQRKKQRHTAKSLWLRTSVALDVAPCSGLALVAGTESEHVVPTPPADPHGRNVERGGFTRACAQSCRPDDCLDDFAFEQAMIAQPDGPQCATRGTAGRVAADSPGRRAGRRAGAGRARQQVQHFVAGANQQPGAVPYHQLHARPGGGWGRARRNRRTGRVY